MIIQGDNLIVNGNTVSGANIGKLDDYISVDANNRVSTTDMIATQSFRIGDDAHWKIRPNGGNAELCFEYSTSNVMSDANIKARFNSSGHFLNPNQPAFAVYGTTGNWAVPTSQTTCPYDATPTFNIGNCYNASTSIFTAPISGLYFVSFGALSYPNNIGAGNYISLWASKNDSGYNSTEPFARLSNQENQTTLTAAGLVYLSANDTLKIKAQVASSGPTLYFQGGHAHFAVYFLG